MIKHCVYTLSKNGKPFYVGITAKPRQRLAAHLKNYGDFVMEVVSIHETYGEARAEEGRLISELPDLENVLASGDIEQDPDEIKLGVVELSRKWKVVYYDDIDWEPYDGVLGTMPDKEVGGMMGLNNHLHVKRRRDELGIAPYSGPSKPSKPNIDWKKFEHLFDGSYTSREIADTIGCHQGTVLRYANRTGKTFLRYR